MSSQRGKYNNHTLDKFNKNNFKALEAGSISMQTYIGTSISLFSSMSIENVLGISIGKFYIAFLVVTFRHGDLKIIGYTFL